MDGYYEIRLESIGGLGANLCGKMLGELGVKYWDLNSASFSSYGSEKTGTPVKTYVRYCEKEKEIRVHAPVILPDLLVVFHPALLRDEEIWKGCGENTRAVIALEDGQEADTVRIPVSLKSCYTVPAQKIAMETHARINVVMLGAIVRAMGYGTLEDTQKICRDTLGEKYPHALPGNLEGIKRGFQEAAEKTDFRRESGNPVIKNKKSVSPIRGYDTAPIGGLNPEFGNTAAVDLSPSRQGYIPVFIRERCINCGLCDTACPDMVFQFVKGEYKGREMMINAGLDYYHCKGCLRCVEVCPVNALVQGLEAEYREKPCFLPALDMVRKPEYYVEAGPDGYITSEAYLTEKRQEGGEV